MKPLIVGEAPSKNEDPERPIEGRIGLRLATCAGLTLPEFLAHFDRVNLLHVRQDTAAHGFPFDLGLATQAAAAIRRMFTNEMVVLLLGKRVAAAFGLSHADYFLQLSLNGPDIRVIPHPSGINRWWNDPKNMRSAEVFMENIVRRTR